jgi:hypothetical protein
MRRFSGDLTDTWHMGGKVTPQLFVRELSREVFRVEAVDFCR